MKKICCFIASLAGGGAERQMSYLSNFLSEKGYDVTLVTYNDIEDFYQLNKEIKRVRLNVHGNRLKKQWQIIKFLLKTDMDCLISYRLQMNFIALWAMLFRPKIKCIVGERNFTVTKPSVYRWWCMLLLYRRADWVVPNNYSQEKFLANFPHASYIKRKLKTIINFTDLELFKAVPIPSKDDVIKIGVFARFEPQKNYERFSLAIKELKNKVVRPFQVIWYGNIFDKNGNYQSGYLELKKLIEDYELQNQFILKPRVKNVHEEIKQFHAICLPSIHEGFSNSIAEGICSGRPMLVSDIGDNKLMVEDGVSGYLFNPNDVHSITSALEKYLSLDVEAREAMARCSRIIAEKLFDKERFVNDYIKIIES